MLFGNAALIERLVTFGGESVGIQCDEWVFRAVFLQAVIEGEEAGQVCRVSDEGGPY